MDIHRREDLRDLEEDLGYLFEELSLLDRALTHKSFANESGEVGDQNERLEFLGDSVVGLCVANMLFEAEPKLSEGDMSKVRAYLVKEESLSQVARSFGLGGHIRMGKGETRTGGAEKDSILANAFEALVAAIYLDGGFKLAYEFVETIFQSILGHVGLQVINLDYKTQLQEFCQARYQKAPTYKLAGSSGPDHDKTFEVQILLGRRVIGRGSGKSKKEAEQRGASEALDLLK